MLLLNDSFLLDWHWLDFDELDSTNTSALTYAQKLVPYQKTVITAVKQTAGKGRRGHAWQGLDGNLFFSLVLNEKLENLSKLVLLSSLVLFLTIKELSGKLNLKLQLKWPNDVFVNNAKISGILFEKGEGDILIAGIGVNIVHAPSLPEAAYDATSLKNVGILTDRVTFLKNYLEFWEKTRDTWFKNGFEPLKNLWLENAMGLNEEVCVTDGNKMIKGIFSGVSDDGALLLDTSHEIVKIYAGDVSFFSKDIVK